MSKNTENLELAFAKMQFNTKMRTMIYRKITSFSKQGTPVFNTIDMFSDAYGQKKGDPRSPILKKWLESMSNGSSFSQAIIGFAPESEVMLIAAGEANGDLAGGMSKALFVTSASERIKKALIGGLSYSAVLLMTLLGMVYMFSIKVIPEMVNVMPVEKWPDLSKKLYWLSEYTKNYGLYTVIVFVFFIIVSIKTLGIFRGNVRKVCDYFPPWSIYKTVQGSVFLITVSSMMNAGIPFNSALNRIKELSSPYIQDYINEMLLLLMSGADNGEVMNVDLLNSDLALDIKLLGKTADFQSSMMMLGEQSIEDTIDRINIITKGIGTCVLFLITGFVIFVYGGFFQLTQGITEAAQSMH